MKRIISLLLSAIMVIAIIPVSVFMVAAEDNVLATFEFGANGSAAHADGNKYSTYSEDASGYSLELTSLTNVYGPARDAQGNSCIKLGTSSKTGSFSFTVPDEVTSVVIYAAKYKANASKITVNGTAYTLTNASNNGAYDEITVDTTSTKTVTFSTVSGGVRAMVNTIVFCGTPAEGACTHENQTTGDCTTDTVCNDCGAVIATAPGHSYDLENAVCTECGEDIVEMTIPEILAAEVGTAAIVSGTVTGFYQEWSDYNNCSPYIVDGDGNQLLIYATGTRVGVGDEITVTGLVGEHDGTNQILGQTAIVVIDAQHDCEFSELTCTEDSVCIYCGALNEEATGHNFVNGSCTVCGEAKPTFVTLDFSDKANRTAFSTTQQVWESNGIVFTNDKGTGSNVGDYANPVRLYKNSIITVDYAGITKIVFNCVSNYVLSADDITVGNVTVDGTVVTVEFDEPVDSFTATLTKSQVRFTSIEVYAEASEPEPTPDPEYIRIDGYLQSNVDGGIYNVKFVAAISDLVEGQECFGFEITTTADGGKSWVKTTNTVYSSITANYGTEEITAEDVGGDYIAAVVITGVPANLGAVQFVVTPFTEINDEIIYGEAVTITVNPVQ